MEFLFLSQLPLDLGLLIEVGPECALNFRGASLLLEEIEFGLLGRATQLHFMLLTPLDGRMLTQLLRPALVPGLALRIDAEVAGGQNFWLLQRRAVFSKLVWRCRGGARPSCARLVHLGGPVPVLSCLLEVGESGLLLSGHGLSAPRHGAVSRETFLSFDGRFRLLFSCVLGPRYGLTLLLLQLCLIGELLDRVATTWSLSLLAASSGSSLAGCPKTILLLRIKK